MKRKMKNKSMKNSPIKFTINRGFTMMVSICSINRLYTRSEMKKKKRKQKKKNTIQIDYQVS